MIDDASMLDEVIRTLVAISVGLASALIAATAGAFLSAKGSRKVQGWPRAALRIAMVVGFAGLLAAVVCYLGIVPVPHSFQQ